jgi:hypothetical protein
LSLGERQLGVGEFQNPVFPNQRNDELADSRLRDIELVGSAAP